MKRMLLLLLLMGGISIQTFAAGSRYLYGSDIDSADSPLYYKIDPATGQIVDSYTNLPGVTGGVGVAVVGNVMYYTHAVLGDANVYKYDLATHTDLGLAFSVGSPFGGGSSLAYDGTNLWLSDPNFSNHAYLYTPTGVLLKGITLTDCFSSCVGLEYFVQNGRGFLIASEGDAYGAPSVYDVYDLNGNLVHPHLITVAGGGNWGIAWDGTHFWTADTFALSVNEWDMSGNFIQNVSVTNWLVFPPYLGDLSFDYSQTLPTPEPGTLGCLVTGAVGIVRCLKRKSFDLT